MKLLDLCIKHKIAIQNCEFISCDPKTTQATYQLELVKDGEVIDIDAYSAGSAYYADGKPHHQLKEYELDELAENLTPTVDLIVWCLLSDYESAKDHIDWISWAHDLDMLDNTSVQQLRRLQSDFATIHERGRTLREWFGDDYDEAMLLAQEM
jgi:hypothetical protein